jgi:hypothetical protein
MNDDERTRVFGAAAGPRAEPGLQANGGLAGDAAPHATSRLPIGTRFGEFEIVGMVGQEVYDQLLTVIERPKWTPLPHPAVKRR